MKTRLTHVRVNVRDLDRAIAWYTQALGFEVKAHWPPENPTYVEFECEQGAAFSIMCVEQAPASGRVNFSTGDVDGLWQQLQNSVEVIEPLFKTPYGSRKFTIRDPDGNELGFVQDY